MAQPREAENKERVWRNYDEIHATTPLPTLQPNDHVLVKDMDVEGTVKEAAGTPRSYQVETPKGTLRRNRAHLVGLPRGDMHTPSPKKQEVEKSESLPSPCLATRPKRLFKPSLKLRESLGTDT